MNPPSDDAATTGNPEVIEAIEEQPEVETERLPELRDLPKNVGYMLLSAGVLGVVLPGPGTPAIIAGGLVLWPNGFGKAETWFRRKFPAIHRGGMQHVGRFLKDLENRYPGTTQR